MEVLNLKKRLSTYVAESGRLRNVPDDVLHDLLLSWEAWSGTAKEFYRTLGFSQKQVAKLLGKAKRLKREGHYGTEPFKEVFTVEDQLPEQDECEKSPNGAIELVYVDGKIIRFPRLSQLICFLEKAG